MIGIPAMRNMPNDQKPAPVTAARPQTPEPPDQMPPRRGLHDRELSINTQQAGHTVRSEPARKWHLQWLLYVSAPSMLVITPLVGLPFVSDQRIEMYSAYSQFGVNPLAIAQANYLEIDSYISVGNFRPIGRFVNYFEQAAIFDVATTSLASIRVLDKAACEAMYSGIANMAMVAEMKRNGKKDIGCCGPVTIRQVANRNGNISTGAAQCL